MKKVTKIVIGSVTAIAIAIGVSGFAMAKHHGGMGGYMMYKLEKQLDLNGIQKTNLSAIKSYVETKHKNNPHEAHKNMIKEMLSQPNLDQQKIMVMIEDKMQEMRTNAPEMITKVAAFTDSLTPEQRTELVEMMDKRSFGRHHRGGHSDD